MAARTMNVMNRVRDRWPTLAGLGDIALAGAMVIFGVVGTTGADRWSPDPHRSIDAVGYALVVTAAVSLAARRRWPLPTLGVVTAVTTTYLLLDYTYGPMMVVFAIAVYSVARHQPLRRAIPATAIATVVMLTHVFTHPGALSGMTGLVPGTAWGVVPLSIGVVMRVTREAAARARAEVIRQHVDEERLRIARDVHDIVGHSLTAIKMQSDVALHVLEKKPDQAKAALSTISHTSGEALDELRATLALVQQRDAGADRTPAPGLDALHDLIGRVSDAGVDVDLQVSGRPRSLPHVVDLTCYRVVRESLTNVLRHSGADSATVLIEYGANDVAVTITNPCDREIAGADTGGLGIAGMRERVTSLGGTFTAGVVEGRFQVHVSLPLAESG